VTAPPPANVQLPKDSTGPDSTDIENRCTGIARKLCLYDPCFPPTDSTTVCHTTGAGVFGNEKVEPDTGGVADSARRPIERSAGEATANGAPGAGGGTELQQLAGGWGPGGNGAAVTGGGIPGKGDEYSRLPVELGAATGIFASPLHHESGIGPLRGAGDSQPATTCVRLLVVGRGKLRHPADTPSAAVHDGQRACRSGNVGWRPRRRFCRHRCVPGQVRTGRDQTRDDVAWPRVGDV